MEPFWVNVFTQASESPSLAVPKEEKQELWAPINREVIMGSKVPKQTTAGPDGITGKDFHRIPKVVLYCLYNLFMWCGELPKILLGSRTIFIPKKGFEGEHEKYRPITIPSVLVRGFHGILPRRLALGIW